MKLRNRILSLLIVMLFIFNSFPFVYADRGGTLILTGDIESAITDVEYGTQIYQFDDSILGGIAPDDEVHLVADAAYDSPGVGSRKISLTNFQLIGNDASNYMLPSITEPVEKEIQITPKVIEIAPAKTYIYYGQTKLFETNDIMDYSSQVVPDDEVKLEATFVIAPGDDIRDDYSIEVIGTIKCDNDNYEAILDDTVKFEVREYVPDSTVETDTNNYAGVKTATLTAPDGFLISESNDGTSFKSSIVIDLLETKEGTATYYLRNNDPTDTEYYQAISNAKTYNYTSVQTLPAIESVKVEKADSDSILNFSDSGVFSNGSVNVTVEAIGTFIEQETKIYLGEDGNYDAKIATSELKDDGKYHYTAQFTYNEPKSIELAYASNSSGKGKAIGVKFTDDEGNECPAYLVLDNVQPNIDVDNASINSNDKVNDSDSNYTIRALVTIVDGGPDDVVKSGIAKIEYKWDNQFKLNGEIKDDYVEYTGSINTSGETYEFILPWEDIIEDNKGKHTLHLRVTDRAGNISEVDLTDKNGRDVEAPQITGVKITKTENSVLNFLSFGTFANDSIKIAVTVNDHEGTSEYYCSGVKSVYLKDQEMVLKVPAENPDDENTDNENIQNQDKEYVLVVPVGTALEDIEICVKDDVGWFTTKKITEITDSIKSNHLIVENAKPTIEFSFSSSEHTDNESDDNESKIWFDENDKSETVSIKVSDSKGEINSGLDEINSGLYSFTIYDNDEEMYSKYDFGADKFSHEQIIKICKFDEGFHKLTVIVVDNAGNESKDTIEFSTDYTVPSGKITVTNPLKIKSTGALINTNPLGIEPTGVQIGTEKWFDKDDIIYFRVDASDARSGLDSISLKINDQQFDFSRNEIQKDSQGHYVSINTTKLDPNDEHQYIVTGEVTDIAGNTLKLSSLTVHKDLEEPKINKLTVEKKNETIIDKILNVLTFGIYSNDSLVLKAYVSDAEYDSGIDYVTVNYDGLTEPKRMDDEGEDDEGNHIYSCEIPVGTEVFQSDISVIAYDKYGKESSDCPNIENAEQDKGTSNNKFVMIETIKPDVHIEIPNGDGIERTDGQIWYNTNKEITMTVQDEQSGIRDVDLRVNGTDITVDKNNTPIPKISDTELELSRDTDKHSYLFDTDYFISQMEEEPVDGKYTVKVEVTDNAGNITSQQIEYYIDKIAPTIDKIEFSPATSDDINETSEFIEVLEYGYYFKTDFIASIHVSDLAPSSGLHKVYYRLVSYGDGINNDEISGSQKVIDGKVDITVPKGFKGQIYAYVLDNTGNQSDEKTPRAFIIDDVSPEIVIIDDNRTEYRDANNNKLFVSDISFTVTISDYVSGIREIGYYQNSEKESFSRKVITLENAGYNIGDDLGDGWIVSEMDFNLVTEVSKSFYFHSDDNDIILTFDATDRSGNTNGNIYTDKFTIDLTNPTINVVFRDSQNSGQYYNANRIADITVIERNFDLNLINTIIENNFGEVPDVVFTQKSNTEYVAVVNFDEGDYTFDINGTDLGNHLATANFSGGNEKLFFVDKTIPVIEENFTEFSNSTTEDSFNIDKTVAIKITEHNFDPDLVNLRITSKSAGEEHDASGLEDVTDEVLDGASWESTGDVHTISFTVMKDAVYQVEITPSDLAGNVADYRSTVVFEIDQTAPIVEAKNGVWVSDDDIEFLDIYPYSRKDDPAPTVEFSDLNIDHINYVLTVYIPDYTSPEAATIIQPVRVYLDEDENKSGKISGNIFTLPNFVNDGVYELQLIAVDVAGNESLLNVNTYARMVEQDVLAYILESNLANKTGLYSFQYENGDAISKRPDSFSDIKIFVLAKKGTDIDVVLRDNNGDEINTNTQPTTDDSIYGMGTYNFILTSNFFKENFQDDTDAELHLTVKNEGYRIDLGKLHIDNIAPTYDMPGEFQSWHWYYGDDDRTITISNISELLDENQCKVYDNGQEVEFEYSSEDNTLVFTLEKGWHNVGVTLGDMAENTNYIQEKSNIHIGFFWLWVIMVLLIILIGAITFVIIHNIRNKRKSEND